MNKCCYIRSSVLIIDGFQHQNKRLEQEKQLVTKQVSWLEAQLREKSDALLSVRRDNVSFCFSRNNRSKLFYYLLYNIKLENITIFWYISYLIFLIAIRYFGYFWLLGYLLKTCFTQIYFVHISFNRHTQCVTASNIVGFVFFKLLQCSIDVTRSSKIIFYRPFRHLSCFVAYRMWLVMC